MRTTLHLVWNDFRRLRWWIGLLALAGVATDVLGLVLLHGGISDAGNISKERWLQITTLNDTLFGMELFFTYVTALLLVQGDSLHGTRAFWFTRPISWQRLLLSKLITGLLVIVVLPLVIALPWWLWCGFSPAALGSAILPSATRAIVIGIAAAFVGALCNTLSRAIVWGCLIVPLVLMFAAGIHVSGEAVRPIPFMAMAALTLLTLVTATVVQFATRKLVVSVAVCAVGIALTALLPGVWKRPVRVIAPPPWDSNAELAKDVTLEFLGAREFPRNKEVTVTISLSPGGVVPAGAYAAYEGSSHVWQLAGGPRVERFGSGYRSPSVGHLLRDSLGMSEPAIDAETKQWRAERFLGLNGRQSALATKARTWIEPPGSFSVATIVAPSIAARIGKERPPYQGTFQGQLLRPRIIGELALAPGWSARDSMGCRINKVTKAPDGIGLLVVETASVDLGGSPFPTEARPNPGMSYLLVKPGTTEATVPSITNRRSLSVGRVRLTWRVISTKERVNREGKWVAPEKPWYEGAKLAMVTADEVARFTRTIQVPKFAFGPIGAETPDGADAAVP